MEHWADIEDFPQYEVSDEGRVRNKDTQRVLKPLDNKRGGLMVIMHRDGKGNSRLIRRLVANAFLEEGYPGEAPVHIDGDYTNCRAENLSWRPRWKAAERTKQMKRTTPVRVGTIRSLTTGETWGDTLECALAIDGFERYVIDAIRWRGNYQGHRLEFVY